MGVYFLKIPDCMGVRIIKKILTVWVLNSSNFLRCLGVEYAVAVLLKGRGRGVQTGRIYPVYPSVLRD